MKRVAAAAVVAALAVPLLVAATSETRRRTPRSRKARRVLVISLPGVTWQDIQERVHELPHLTRLLDSSAIGGLTTRTIDRHTTLADGYVTLGAGTRSVGTEMETDGEGFEVGEPFAGTTAGRVFGRRTGRTPTSGLVNLGIGGIVDKNKSQLFDAEIGALGDKLATSDWSRAVIANGDGEDTEQLVGGYYRRQAVSGLMGSDGELPAGAVGPELLVPDARAPFGLRYDNNAVLTAFRDVWKPHTVALVEASDLVREDAYRPFATSSQRARLLDQALRRTDQLVGGLLREVDPKNDAVMVVGPVHPARKVQLTVAALRAPGVQPGLLRTGTTRRPGFVQIVDIAPTILDRIGLTAPDSMEGRPFEIHDEGGSAAQRRAGIVDANAAATFRDEVVSVVAIVFVVIQIALVLGALVWLARPDLRRLGTVLHLSGLAALGFIAAVLLAQLVPFQDYGNLTYWGALAAASLGLAVLYRFAGRRTPLAALILGLGVIVAVLVVDVLFGAPLQLSNPLGYSPLLAARFSGYGNLAYSALASAAVLLAGLLAHRIGGRRGVWTAIAVLAVVFVVDGAPMWGSDVGGILSILPAYARDRVSPARVADPPPHRAGRPSRRSHRARGLRPVRPDPSVRQADAPRPLVRDHAIAWLDRLFDGDRAQDLRQPLGASRLHVAARGVGGARFPRLRVFETARPSAGDRRLGAGAARLVRRVRDRRHSRVRCQRLGNRDPGHDAQRPDSSHRRPPGPRVPPRPAQ